MPFKYDIPLADRFGQLVNNEFAADVFFEVGSSQRLMYGHRSILSVGSPVFNAQLNGDFVEARNNSRQHPIVVTDVEEDVFLQILRYIYSANATVNHRNAVELYYASQKYLLIDLRCICENFFNSSLWKENVVTVFNANRKHEFPIVNDCCLEIICDNPLRFLSDPFLLI
ncbi:BTB/POZ domain-containing protein 6-like isoform X3 [Culex pipiens pallens]|uniref:BTB/POZ domain-containing protein 6-like isoform X3 n=1 Tax=Culex pipiens pallens TaxID=42434 RepID=UPI001953AD83|nr:BTB/POZ domain-containing protein 6-like isoform X3 [Culex pipiens pallens]